VKPFYLSNRSTFQIHLVPLLHGVKVPAGESKTGVRYEGADGVVAVMDGKTLITCWDKLKARKDKMEQRPRAMMVESGAAGTVALRPQQGAGASWGMGSGAHTSKRVIELGGGR
jgi:hypothetical protein